MDVGNHSFLFIKLQENYNNIIKKNMNAKKEKFENIFSNFPHLENTATQIKSHEIINIPIPSTDTNKRNR